MSRILLVFLCCLSFTVSANSPLSINKRLGLGESQAVVEKSTEEQLQWLNEQLEQQITLQKRFEAVLHQYSTQKQKLNTQLENAAKPLSWDAKQNIEQQSAQASTSLAKLKETESNLSQQTNELIKRQRQLPSLITQANQSVAQLKKAGNDKDTRLTDAQNKLSLQTLSTLETELASSQKQIALSQQQLNLVRRQLLQQERLIEELNSAISLKRHKTTAATIAESQIDSLITDDLQAIKINQQNQTYSEQLQQLTYDMAQVATQQEQAEIQYQFQAKQLTNIQQQIALVKLNSAFGERFLRILSSLPKPPNQDDVSSQIANARLARYQLEQDQALAASTADGQTEPTQLQSKLLESQQKLQRQLLENYDLYIGELAELRVLYEQLNQQYRTLKTTLNEHLFWVANANSIDSFWFSDLLQSSHWLVTQAPWQQLHDSFDAQGSLWATWVILMVLCLVLQDLITPIFHRTMAHNMSFVGKVTQDKFIYTFSALITSLLYSAIKPLPLIMAGIIFYLSKQDIVSAVGMAMMTIGALYWLHRVTYLLSLDNGILIGHFKGDAQLIHATQERLKHFTVMTVPFIGIVSFTEVMEASMIRNSLGRGAFILFAIMLFWFYKDILQLAKKERHYHQDDKNKRLLQKVLWAVLLILPPACAILAFRGYYYTAFQMLLQLQLSLILWLSFMLLYLLIKRWMLIERRRIAFNRAKAKRAEIIAQREKEGESIGSEGDTYEEPEVDLETISSQSLGLVRSLLTLAFLISLIGLWTQTHSAIFSFLDGITLWTSSTVIDGIAQPLPITLKSLLLGLIIVGFSLMIATNLPGLLELMILQRLELSQGTGFAVTTVSRYLVVFFGMLGGFSTLGMEWSKLQWLVAALSVGLGFGLQEIFANFISGLIILFEKPVRIGDTVTIRDLTGTVSKIQIRATTIVDWDRKEIIVPNKAFITEQLINWSLSDPITRVIVYVSVARDSDPAKVEAVLYQAVQESEEALTTPEPEVWFAGFGKHTQDYEIRAYAKDMSARWPLRHALHNKVSKKLKENGLELAFPQLEVHIKGGQGKDTQGLIRS
ncbi:mechanosensitive ion channel domain-containing protein [Shewanella sp. Isolate11]|uniref:mechanosensitive ion channel domain-containing protein n=1 Tax=Shewanella sp. Isolate11 TaxID=2908530 RepID=UPI001EFD6DA6|nr:mechanosensitive ion channel domain-containing protein [Shewanella sp. Isolate11]MCG9697495.1 mechanosensitive ion channel [Shewanella sp. Isolate11]